MKELVAVLAVLALVVSGIGISAQAKKINHLESRIAKLEQEVERFQGMWLLQVELNQMVHDYAIVPMAQLQNRETELTREDKMVLGLASLYLAPEPQITVEPQRRRFYDYPR